MNDCTASNSMSTSILDPDLMGHRFELDELWYCEIVISKYARVILGVIFRLGYHRIGQRHEQLNSLKYSM